MSYISRAIKILRKEGLKSLLIKTNNHFSIDRKVKKSVGLPFRLIANIWPVDDSLVLFGTRPGRLYEDNTRHVYEWILANDSTLNPVWMTREQSVYNQLADKGHPVCKIYSIKGLVLLMRAACAVCTHSKRDISIHSSWVPDSITTIQAGHGFPVKGNPKNPEEIESARETIEKWDYILLNSEFSEQRHLRKITSNEDIEIANKKQNPTVEFVPTGYPRNDLLIDVPNKAKESWDSYIGDEEPEHVILYAPTNHPTNVGDDTEPAVDFFPFGDFDQNALYDFLEERNAVLLFRPHPVDVRNMQKYSYGSYQRMHQELNQLCSGSKRVRMATQYEITDTNDLLPFVDILITDYSSIYHDFLLLDRPILFIPYDYELFEQKNGFNYEYWEFLPGPAIETEDAFYYELSSALENEELYSDERKVLRDKLYKYKDDECRRRVYELIKKVTP